MFTDTHTHLYAEEFDNDRTSLISSAISAGISCFFLPNIDSGSIGAMLSLEKEFPAHCFAMMGLHPCSVTGNVEKELMEVRAWLDKRKFAGMGEIGMDLYWDKTFEAQQKHAFRIQCEWAVEFDYAVSIHSRNAFEETYQILAAMNTRPRGVFHCFSGTREEAEKVVTLGNFKLGIGGVITFKNSGLDKALAGMDPENFVLETDAPYLAPVPHRGKRNEPVYLIDVARKLAEVCGVELAKLEQVTCKNAENMFRTGT
jgi:TatD DNase family protein